jgi:hypothetical protein
MSKLPEYHPPPKRRTTVLWIAALSGLVLVNVAADSFARTNHPAVGWSSLGGGIPLLLFAIRQAAR